MPQRRAGSNPVNDTINKVMAIYCPDLKLLYVSTPRTGSTTVSLTLRNEFGGIDVGWKHSTIAEAIKAKPLELKRLLKVTAIRNPFDSTVSKYFKLKNERGALQKTALQQWVTENNASFAETLMFNPRVMISHSRTDKEVLRNKFDFLIRFENLQDDFDKMMRLVGEEPFELPIRNETPERDKDYRIYYDKESRLLVEDMMSGYLRFTDYTFSGHRSQIKM